MATKEKVRREAKPLKPKPTAKKREVVLAPDLFEAVLESVEQAKRGQVLTHDEVKQRHEA